MEAMGEIYQLFEGPVYTLAIRICSSPADAEDVLQETFLKLFQKLNQFRGDSPFWGWLRKIAINTALTKLRQEVNGPSALDGVFIRKSAVHESVHNSDPADAIDLDSKLSRLPAVTRTVLWLHTVEGYTHAEIAEMMGKTESFSKSQLSRAYEKLRKWLRWNNTAEQDIQARQNS